MTKRKTILKYRDERGEIIELIMPLVYEEYEKLSDKEKAELLKALAQNANFTDLEEGQEQ